MGKATLYELSLDLILNDAKLQEGITSANSKLNDLGKNSQTVGSQVIGAFSKMGAIVGGVVGAFESVKKVFEATEGSSDSLNQNIGLLTGGMQGLFQTIDTGDWGALIENIKNAALATKGLKIETEELSHITAGNTIRRGTLEEGLYASRNSAMTEKDPATKAGYVSDAISYQKQITDLNVSEANKRVDIDENYFRKITGHSKEYFDYFLTQVPSIAQNWEHWFGKDSEQLNLLKTRLSDLTYLSKVQMGGLTTAQKEEQHQLQLSLYALQDYKTLQDSMKPEQWDGYVMKIGEVRSAIAEGEKALIRLNKQLATAIGKISEMSLAQMAKSKANPITAIGEKTFDPNGVNGYGREFSNLTMPSFDQKQTTPGLRGVGMEIAGQWITGAAAIATYIKKLKEERAANIENTASEKSHGLMLNTLSSTVQGLGSAFGELAAGTKGSMKSMVTIVLQGLQQVIDAYLAVAIAATVKNDVEYGGPTPIALILAATGVAALVAFWSAKVPAFASGTNSAPGGWSMVGEKGPELVNLSRGAQVFSNSQTSSMLTSPKSVLIKFQDGSLQGYMDYQNRKINATR